MKEDTITKVYMVIATALTVFALCQIAYAGPHSHGNSVQQGNQTIYQDGTIATTHGNQTVYSNGDIETRHGNYTVYTESNKSKHERLDRERDRDRRNRNYEDE